jgi:hypothetical protein
MVPGAVVVVADEDNVDVVVDPPDNVVDVVEVVDGNVVVVADADVVVVVGVRHAEGEIVLSIIVTAPLIARTRPLTTAASSSVIDVRARIVPMKFVEEPSVAELPTSQKTLHACAPFSSTTEADDAVVSVVPACRMKTASAFPSPLRVRAPVSCMLDVA